MKITVSDTDAGKRLDVFISENTELSRSLAAKLIESGDVTLGGTRATKKQAVFAGDIIDAAAMSQIRNACEKQIPSNFLPKFRLIGAEYESSYLEGMYQIALEMKQNLTTGW